MLGVETVAEGMADHVISHHPTMPGVGETAQAIVSTRCLEDSLHTSMMTIVPHLRNTRRRPPRRRLTVRDAAIARHIGAQATMTVARMRGDAIREKRRSNTLRSRAQPDDVIQVERAHEAIEITDLTKLPT
jgi:hypothetical protein